MPATPWTELSTTANPWSVALPSGDGSDDFYIDFLFEGTPLIIQGPTAHTELTMAVATPTTELTVASTPWTELTG